MGKQFTLTTTDKHSLGAYRADPQGKAKGGMVVVQEIFGVNHHIRAVCDRFAGDGYVAVAPALFDRMTRNFESGYSPAEIEKARSYIAKPDWDAMLRDTDAALKEIQSVGPIAIVGFCMGGTIAFLSAARLSGWKCAIAYYGGRIVAFADERPKCPVQMHFGENDQSIPMTDVEIIKQKRPECEIYVYKGAGHGFHCDERGSFHQPSATLAWERAQAFLKKHMA
ncbi:MAG TPA: dienelactone hydrolase family protein [Xanthobacteraceae bacterium]|nr:dienelactone hydrolase family protein [Xanthobacteraceae bacterium]